MIVVMGVSGAGKSTIGRLVAERLGVPFLDADDFHDPSNIASMRAGHALDDAQRQPWLRDLNDQLRLHQSSGLVLACSALKRSYRDALRDGLEGVLCIELAVSEQTLARRIGARSDHFAGPDLLESQLATLEGGDDVIVVDAEGEPNEVATEIVRVVVALGRGARDLF